MDNTVAQYAQFGAEHFRVIISMHKMMKLDLNLTMHLITKVSNN